MPGLHLDYTKITPGLHQVCTDRLLKIMEKIDYWKLSHDHVIDYWRLRICIITKITKDYIGITLGITSQAYEITAALLTPRLPPSLPRSRKNSRGLVSKHYNRSMRWFIVIAAVTLLIGVQGAEECCMKANNYTMQMVDTAGE